MQKQKMGGICLLQVILCVMVVLIHTRPFISYPSVDAITSNGIFRIAVPLFFLMNGYFFNFERVQVVSKVKKTLVLYIFLLMLFSPFWINLTTPYGTIKSIIYNVVIGWHHLWYLSSLIVASIVIYIMRSRLVSLFIFSIILFIASYAVQNAYLLFDGAIFEKLNHKPFIYRNAFTFAIPFMLIGVYIRKSENLKVSPLMISASLMLMFAEVATFALLEKKSGMARDLYLTLLFTAPILFLMFKNISLSFEEKVSGRVYFYHPISEMTFKSAGYDGGFIISISTIVFAFMFAIIIDKMKSKNIF